MKNHLGSRSLLKLTVILTVITLGIVGLFSCSQNSKEILQKPSQKFEVTLGQARTVAENFNFLANKAKGNIKSSAKARKVSSVDEVKDQDGEPLFYIMNYDSSGFVIVSGDNRIRPILAFAEKHSFKMDKKVLDNTGLGYWIYATKNGIRKIRKKALKQNPAIKEAWNIQLGLKIVPVDPPCTDYSKTYGPLMTTTWGQGCGYNTLLQGGCLYNCGHVPTGCVATAMAQVMKYHNFPLSYNWSAMPNAYGSSETARLMKDIGASVGMVYGCEGSGAYGTAIAPAFVNTFGYSTPQYINYAGSVNAGNVVVSEFAENRPVIFTGVDYSFHPAVGHAWVSDGSIDQFYCDSGNSFLYFHMNWGWSSPNANGWFSFNTFTPTAPNGTTYNFYSDSKVVINIHP